MRCCLTLAFVGLLTVGCQHTWPPEALVPACPAPSVDTSAWVVVRAPNGRFTIRLPVGSRDLRLHCIDSDCGVIAVGGWTLTYDGGLLDGGGDSIPTPPDAARATTCSEWIDGRVVHIATYQFTHDPRNGLHGNFVATAVMRIEPRYPMIIGVMNRSPRPLAVFLAALRTFHAEPRQ